MRWSSFFLYLLVGLQACSESKPAFHQSENPLRLSDWNLLSISNGELQTNPATLRFQPLNTLFTDYAHKLRTMWIPADQQVELVDNRFIYPVGTVLSKTFYYPFDGNGGFARVADAGDLSALSLSENRLIETRLLVRRQAGWEAFPYVWNDEQTEAFLRVAGTSLPVSLTDDSGTTEFTYFVPNENQCSGCHTRIHPNGGLEPLGAVAHQLNFSLPGATQEDTVLDAMAAKGWLSSMPTIDAIPDWKDESLPLAQRAAAYMDMNCGHCHNPDGPADTSALMLDGFDRTAREMGSCKPPVAAGGGAGNRLYGIVPGEPDESILLYRMQSVEPDEMMPELGRALVHEEGLALIREWISNLSGDCE